MQIVRCQACSMMYQNPRVVETEMLDAHETIENYHRLPEQDIAKGKLFRNRVEAFAQQRPLPAVGSFLDVGAARGIMLDSVAQSLPQWRLFAAELSPSARAHLVAQGYPTVPSIEDLPTSETFDWINLDNVLEHLPDPQGSLVSLRARLKPKGFIYVEVPNESFFTARYRINDFVRGFRKAPTSEGHVNLFTSRTLSRMFQSTGFVCEKMWLESVSVPWRLKAATGADETPRVRKILRFLRFTQLDVALRLGYFLCATIRLPS